MRMDNETFRLKVENLFASVRSSEGGLDPGVMAQLEKLAATPRKGRYFLQAASAQSDPELEEHFYRLVFSNAKGDQDAVELERHIRHMFYNRRERVKELLGKIAQRETLPALYRVIAITEEGWLAGELIRIVLAAPADEAFEPLSEALDSKEYLLQCLAIYLIGKAGNDRLLHLLAQFYRRPVGEKIDRLERKAFDALLEGGKAASDDLIFKWIKDKSSRVREVGLILVQERNLVEAAADVAGLLLIDPKTRAKAAETLLHFEREGSFAFDPDHPRAGRVASLVQKAKASALQEAMHSLMRDESAAVREGAVKLARFLKEPRSVTGQVRRLAVEDRSADVQVAALYLLRDVDREKLTSALVDLFTDTAANRAGGREAIEAARRILESDLSPEEVKAVEEGIKEAEERREAALNRFSGSVEWWRHDM